MENFSKNINWYPNNVLTGLKSDEPSTIDEVTPNDTMPQDTPAQEVPNYPVTEFSGDELSVSEINDNNDTLIKKGEVD